MAVFLARHMGASPVPEGLEAGAAQCAGHTGCFLGTEVSSRLQRRPQERAGPPLPVRLCLG